MKNVCVVIRLRSSYVVSLLLAGFRTLSLLFFMSSLSWYHGSGSNNNEDNLFFGMHRVGGTADNASVEKKLSGWCVGGVWYRLKVRWCDSKAVKRKYSGQKVTRKSSTEE